MGLKIALVTTWNVRCGIASYSENLKNALVEEDVEVYVVKIPRFGQKTAETAIQIARKIPYEDIDLIHLQHEYGLWQEKEKYFFAELKTNDKPLVTTMHGIGNWKLDPIVAKDSDKLIVHNEFCAKRLGYPNVIIPHGAKVEYDIPPSKECKKSLGIPEEAPIVGYLGYISEYKGVDILVEVMKKIPEAALLVAGRWFTEGANPYISGLQNEAVQSLKGRCRFTGFVSNADLPRTYGAMDIVVYPSRYATESGALITALGHGRPVIASNLLPFREKAKQGALITYKNIVDLRRKIRKYLRNEQLRKKLSEGAYAYAESTSWTKIAKLHTSLYEHVIKGHHNE